MAPEDEKPGQPPAVLSMMTAGFDPQPWQRLLLDRIADGSALTERPDAGVRFFPLAPVVAPVRTCEGCGCTDADCRGCIQRTGEPCYWISAARCSACAPADLGKITITGSYDVFWLDDRPRRRAKGVRRHIRRQKAAARAR